MGNKIIKLIVLLISLVIILISIVSSHFIFTLDKKDLYSVSDRVKVSENIIQGYKTEDYIPRSASINKKLTLEDG